MRLLCLTLLSAMLLAPVGMAHGLDIDEVLEPLGLPETASTEPRSASTSGIVPDVEEAQAAVEERRAEVEQAAEEAGRTAGQKVEEAEDILEPGHRLVDEARRQVDDVMAPPEEAVPEEQTVTPQGEASVVRAWPEYAPPVMLFTGAAAGFGILAWLLGQTATVGAGAAGTAAARDGRRFLPLASPLFTRFERDTVLGHPKREAIYGQIIGKPGITLQDLCEVSGLSRTAVTHHLRLLEQQHLVVSKRVGRSRHFFENGGRYGRNQKDAYAVLHNDRSKQIHAFIASNPGAIQKDLCGAFDIQASVAHWHVKRLLEAQLVEAVRQGRTVSYFPCGESPQAAYA